MPNNVESLTITQNGTYTPQQAGHGYSPVTVNVDAGFEPDDFADGSVKTDLTGAITLSTATKIGRYAFYGYTNITSINAPEILTVGSNAFENNTHIVTLNLPNFIGNSSNKIVDDYAIRGCSNLQNLILPSLSQGGWPGASFTNVTSLKRIDLGVISSVSAFLGATSFPLDTIILRKTTAVQKLTNSTILNPSIAFKNGGTGGTIYIPEALYSHLGDGSSLDYRAATNWSVYDGYGTITWAKLEGSQYESIYWGNNI